MRPVSSKIIDTHPMNGYVTVGIDAVGSVPLFPQASSFIVYNRMAIPSAFDVGGWFSFHRGLRVDVGSSVFFDDDTVASLSSSYE